MIYTLEKSIYENLKYGYEENLRRKLTNKEEEFLEWLAKEHAKELSDASHPRK